MSEPNPYIEAWNTDPLHLAIPQNEFKGRITDNFYTSLARMARAEAFGYVVVTRRPPHFMTSIAARGANAMGPDLSGELQRIAEEGLAALNADDRKLVSRHWSDEDKARYAHIIG